MTNFLISYASGQQDTIAGSALVVDEDDYSILGEDDKYLWSAPRSSVQYVKAVTDTTTAQAA